MPRRTGISILTRAMAVAAPGVAAPPAMSMSELGLSR